MTNTPAVELNDVSFHYGDTPALKEISFQIEKGVVFGLLGPNGSGKTTLFKILSTLISPASGEVHVMGNRLQDHQSRIRREIAVVFQSSHVDPVLTARENLEFHASLYGLDRQTFLEKQKSMLSLFELSERADDPIKTYSGGMRRRLEVAMGLLHDPEILILDEPTAGLDLTSKRTLWNHLNHLNQKNGLSILVATHDMEEAEYCDSIAILNNGTCEKVDTRENLKQMMGGDILYLDVENPDLFKKEFEQQFSVEARVVENRILIEKEKGHDFIPRVIETFPGEIRSVTLREPTLGDVFMKLTGKKLVPSQ